MMITSVWYTCKLCGDVFADRNATVMPGTFDVVVRSFPICGICEQAAKEIEDCPLDEFGDGPNDAELT